MKGTPGNDIIYGGNNNDTLAGSSGEDKISGGAGEDRLSGEDGDDTLNGGKGADVLKGGGGDDNLRGGSADDRLSGGEGDDDIAIYSDVRASYEITEISEGRFEIADKRFFTFTPEGTDTLDGVEFAKFTDQIVRLGDNKPIDFTFLQDLSGSFGNDIANVQSAARGIAEVIRGLNPDSAFATASFIDQPFSPYGRSGDYEYRAHLSTTTSIDSLVSTISGLDIGSGGDGPEAQLTGLLNAANGVGLNYREDTQRFVLLSTDNRYHTGEGYPSVASVKAALEANNVIPIFATAGYSYTYNNLVDQLGRGTVVNLTSDSDNLADSVRAAVSEVTGTSGEFGSIGRDSFTGRDGLLDSYFGLGGDDTIDGRGGDDFLDGGAGFDTMFGGFGADTLRGGSDDDELHGDEDDDFIDGGPGADDIDGGDGRDTLSYGASDAGVIVDLSTGTASGGHAEGDSFTAIENATGSGLRDRLTGDTGANVLRGGAGNDRLTGKAGADELDGGAGNDTASYAGSSGGIVVNLAAGTATGGDAAGDRLIRIENLVGTAHDDTFRGDDADNWFAAGAGDDLQLGAGGDDYHVYGGGWDDIRGGSGRDAIDFGQFGSAVWVDLTSPNAVQAYTRDGADLSSGSWRPIAAIDSVERLIGTDYDDFLRSGATDDRLRGGLGNDRVEAGSGDDTLIHTAGRDVLDGGAGWDSLTFDGYATAVWIDLSAAGANGYTRGRKDVSTGTWEAIAEINGVDQLTGSAHWDELRGDAGANVLDGGGGNDLLRGGGGEDRFIYSAGRDRFLGGEGVDTADFSGFGSAVWVQLGFTGANQAQTRDSADLSSGDWRAIAAIDGTENVIGTDHDDLLVGDGADNTLRAGAGDDTLGYRGGEDLLDGGRGTDAVDFSDFGAAVWLHMDYAGRLAVQTRDGPDLESGTWRGLAAIEGVENVTGSAYDDELRGDAGNNRLNGGLGDDRLLFGAGVDQLIGAGGTDTVDFSGYAAAVWAHLDFTGAYQAQSRARSDLDSGPWRPLAQLSSIENLVGTRFDDELRGDGRANVLSAGRGDDTLIYTAGRDTLDGGDGRDLADFGDLASALWLRLDQGGTNAYTRDTADLDSGTWRGLGALSGIEDVRGTAFADSLRGGTGDNALYGRGGNDTLIYTGGADHLNGGAGTDTADFNDFGSAVWVDLSYAGREQVFTRDTGDLESGNWRALASVTGIENVAGSAYDDELHGDAGRNRLAGRDGDDTFVYGSGLDTLVGNGGSDTVDFSDLGSAVWAQLGYTGTYQAFTRGGSDLSAGAWQALAQIESSENLVGTGFDDELGGSGDDNRITAGAGNDSLGYTGGTDILDGGTGTDTAHFDDFGSAVWVHMDYVGVHEALTRDSTDLTSGSWRSAADLVDIEHLSGSAYDDELRGDAGDNTLDGNGGNDRLVYGDGHDTLIGGAGTDTADFSGFGSAVWVHLDYYGANNALSRGTDDLTSGTWQNVARLQGIENVTGTAGDDELRGNAGRNRLDGRDGDDVLQATAGSDILTGGDGADRFVFDSGIGTATVRDFSNGADHLDLTAFDFADFAAVAASASESAGNLQIALGDGDQITVRSLGLAEFSRDDVLI